MKIALLGDMAFFGKYSINENSQVFEYFKDVREVLKNYDYVIANLESPFIQGHKPNGYKSAYVGADKQNVELLKYLGISIVNLANNHVFDYGTPALDLTKNILNENGIQFFGIANKSVKLEGPENKIELNGYCCFSTNPTGVRGSQIQTLNFEKVKEKIKYNQTIGVNNIISVHAGQEHVNYPNYDHVQFARRLSEYAPYVYYGHHPHVLQGVEEYNKSLIAYSLGNFCFDDVYTGKSARPLIKQNQNNKSSIILGLEYQDNKLIRYSITPIFAGDKKIELNQDYILGGLKTYSDGLAIEGGEFKKRRSQLLQEYILNRKAQRNLIWYWKRLNHRYVFIFFTSRINKWRYNRNVKRFLKEDQGKSNTCT